MEKNTALLSERVNLRSALLALCLFVVGLLFMIWAANKTLWAQDSTWQKLVETLGTSLLVTGLITIAWDLIGKRAFAEELLSKVSMSRELMDAGIIQVVSSFQSREIDWDALFEKATDVDLLFLGSSTWRNHNFRQLEALARRKYARLRIVLPDPSETSVTAELSNRMNIDVTKIISRTNDAIEFFQKLSKDFPQAKIEVWLMKKSPLFSVFRFDDKAVVSFYSHRAKLVEVPTIICIHKGEIYNYVMGELSALFEEGSIATKIVPVMLDELHEGSLQ